MNTPNVHPLTTDTSTRYAVAVWVERANQWQAPLDAETCRITGCHTEFARRLENMRSFGTLKAAQDYAQQVFGYAQEAE